MTVYEHEPSMNEKEEAWLITMDKIDPAGYISKLVNIHVHTIPMPMFQVHVFQLNFIIFIMSVVCLMLIMPPPKYSTCYTHVRIKFLNMHIKDQWEIK